MDRKKLGIIASALVLVVLMLWLKQGDEAGAQSASSQNAIPAAGSSSASANPSALPGKSGKGYTSTQQNERYATQLAQADQARSSATSPARSSSPNSSSSARNSTTPFASPVQTRPRVKPAPLEPRAEPYALMANSGMATVRFSVRLIGDADPSTTVYLRQSGAEGAIALNDQGVDGDIVARDNIHGGNIVLDTSRLQPDTCLSYIATLREGESETVSSPFNLCVSAFPIRAAASDATHPLVLPDGSIAVADEVIISVRPNTNTEAIHRLASSINAKVVGSLPTHNLYQLRLPAAVSTEQLNELLALMNTFPEVESASPNGIGSLAGTLPSASQHGLKQVLEYDTWSPSSTGVWDSGAIGSNVTIVVLDSGINRLHPDFGTPGNCQLAENDCGSASTDISPVNHGTMVAGIIAASGGAAGVAQGSKIHSIQIGSYFAPNYTITLFQMIDAFDGSYTNTTASISNSAKGYIASHPEAKVINASFYGGPWGAVYASLLTQLCTAINNTVLSGVTPVAVVVNAAGNKGANDNYYPARCNNHAALTRKELFITVANSSSVSGAVTDTAYLDTLTSQTSTLVLDQLYPSSNFGAWIDIAAPGVQIFTPASGSGYSSPIGTSFSTPLVAGAAAILLSCGVPLDQIESTLRTSANVTVPFPDGSSAPRLDIYRALMSRNRTPTALAVSNNSLSDFTDTSTGVQIGTLTTTDADTCDKHIFSIAGGADAAAFSIGGTANDKLILTAGVLNYAIKPSYAVTLRVTDLFGSTFDQAVTVNVIAAPLTNHAPIIANQSFTINENKANATAVGTVTASDPDAGNTISYSITAGNTGNAFSINAITGVLSVSNSLAITSTFNLTVQVTDNVGASASAAVTVNVNNVPTIANQTFSVSESSSNGTAVGTVIVSDPNGDSLIYSITAGNTGGAFALNASTGALTVGNSTALSYATTPSYALTVQVTDTGSLSASATMTVNVSAASAPAPTPTPTPTPPPAAPPASGGGGGGCSVMPAGAEPDSSLLLVMMVLLAYARRRRLHAPA